MMKQYFGALVLGCTWLFLPSCSSKTEPKDDTPPAKGIALESPVKTQTPVSAKADLREVTLHVDGMADRLKLT